MDLLDALLGIPNKRKLECVEDIHTHFPAPARRCYGGYVPPKKQEASVCESLFIHNGQKEYEEMIEDMKRMSLLRTNGLQKEKRTSRYEKSMKKK